MTLWDVVVVGAGPAGAVAACACSRAGLRTLLIDKATFPRPKVCGGCVNQTALAALAAVGLCDVPGRLGAVPLSRVRLAANGRVAALTWPGGVAVSREALDATLIDGAIAVGATFRSGVRAAMGEADADYRRVTLDSGEELAARVVIAADGLNGRLTGTDAHCCLSLRERCAHMHPPDAPGRGRERTFRGAKGDNAPDPRSRIGAGVVLDTDADFEAGTVSLATAVGGYVGVVRVEGGRLDVAAAFEPAFVRAHGLGPAAVRVLAAAGLPPVPGLESAAWRGTPPLTRRPARVAGSRWFAVGDAAGYVEPFTGEGMGWAMSSAVAVLPLVRHAVRRWDDTLIADWARLHRRVVGRRSVIRGVAWATRRPRIASAVVQLLRVAPVAATPVVRLLHTRSPA